VALGISRREVPHHPQPGRLEEPPVLGPDPLERVETRLGDRGVELRGAAPRAMGP